MKKCRTCKKTNVYERGGILLSKDCGFCLKIKADKRKEKHRQTKTYQESERKRLHKKAWTLMSEWIRRKDANLDGFVYCYTCGTAKHWKKMQAGHFLHNKLDFDEENIHPQCPQCNTYENGKLAIYGIKLANELGREGMNNLLLKANTTAYGIFQLDSIIAELSHKLQTLNEHENP